MTTEQLRELRAFAADAASAIENLEVLLENDPSADEIAGAIEYVEDEVRWLSTFDLSEENS